MQKFLHKALLGLAVICLSIGLIVPAQPASAAPESFTDISSKHWAIGPINQWNNLGLVGGYAGNTFRPNQPITKAEFIAFVNRGFGFTKQAEINFTDVKLGSWFRADIAKAIGRGYALAGDSATFQPNTPLSRLEAAQMLHIVLRLEPVAENALARFTDVGNLTEAERAIVNSIVAGGYLGGYTNNTLRLNSTITRAEMIAILSRGAGEIMNVATTFGPETGTRTLNGNATISKSGTTLRNTVVKGDLYITEGVGDGDVYLTDVVVEGRTIVAGGGSNSVHAGGKTQLAKVKITYPDGTTRLVVEGEASAGEVEFQTPGIVDNSGSTSDARPNIVINVPAGATVEIIGDVNDVTVASSETNLQMGEGSTASNVTATESAQGSTLNIQGNVTGTLANNAPNATTTVASTATVANVTTGVSATGSTTNVQGKVTGTVAVNAPQATTTVAPTATVANVTTSESATGANTNLQGTVTGTVTNKAPASNTVITGTVAEVKTTAGTVDVAAGGKVNKVSVEEGAKDVVVKVDPKSDVKEVTAPEGTEYEYNGDTQTGTVTPPPPTGGGDSGGGDPGPTTPSITGVVVKTPSNSEIPGVTFNSSTNTLTLSGVPNNVYVDSLTVTTSPASSITVNSVIVRNEPVSGFTQFTTTDGMVTLAQLMGDYQALIDVVLNQTGTTFDGDVSLGTLRALLGQTITLNCTIGTTNATITVVLGDASGASVPARWVTASVSGRVITATVNQPLTKLENNLSSLIAAITLVNLDDPLPDLLGVSATGPWYNPLDNARKAEFKTALSGIVGEAWSDITLGDLVGHSIYFKLQTADPDGEAYTVTFS